MIRTAMAGIQDNGEFFLSSADWEKKKKKEEKIFFKRKTMVNHHYILKIMLILTTNYRKYRFGQNELQKYITYSNYPNF